MEDLLSKEHYCHKIHTSLMESSTPSPTIDNPPILQENLDPHFYDFLKI